MFIFHLSIAIVLYGPQGWCQQSIYNTSSVGHSLRKQLNVSRYAFCAIFQQYAQKRRNKTDEMRTRVKWLRWKEGRNVHKSFWLASRSILFHISLPLFRSIQFSLLGPTLLWVQYQCGKRNGSKAKWKRWWKQFTFDIRIRMNLLTVFNRYCC